MKVTVHEYGATVELQGGVIVESRPQDTDEYRAKATALGYANPLAMCQEHDVLHVQLCAWLGIPESFALREAAGLSVNSELAWLEEDAVMAIQRFKQALNRIKVSSS